MLKHRPALSTAQARYPTISCLTMKTVQFVKSSTGRTQLLLLRYGSGGIAVALSVLSTPVTTTVKYRDLSPRIRPNISGGSSA